MEGPYTGFVTALFVESSRSVILAGIDGNGLFRSTDKGNSWQQVSEVKGQFEKIVGENGTYLTSVSGGATYLSTDDGVTWNGVPSGDNRLSLVVDGNLLLTSSQINTSTFRTYYSTDKGKTWDSKPYPETEGATFSFKLGSQIGMIGDSTLYLFNGGQLSKKADWQVSKMSTNVRSASHTPKSAQFTFVGTIGDAMFVTQPNNRSIFRSTDRGESWEEVWKFDPDTILQANTWISEQTLHICTSEAIAISTDRGTTWEEIYRRPRINKYVPWQVPPMSYQFVQFDNTFISNVPFTRNDFPLTKTQGGIYRSTDRGEHWLQVGGAQASVLEMKFLHGDILVSSRDLLINHNRSTHWEPIIGGDGNPVLGGAEGDVIVATFNSTTYRSLDRGKTWDTVRSQFPPPTIDPVLDSANPVYKTNAWYLFRLNEYAWSWDTVHTKDSNGIRLAVSSNVVNINGTLFLTTINDDVYSHCLYRSSDFGKTWHKIVCDLPGSDPELFQGSDKVLIRKFDRTFLAVDTDGNVEQITYKDFTQPAAAFMYGDGIYYVADQKKVFKTEDKGRTWEAISDDRLSSRTKRLFWDNGTLFLVFNERGQNYADSIYYYDVPGSLKKYQLTVQNGYGSGLYALGDTVHIWSRELDSNEVFSQWEAPVSSSDRFLLSIPDEWHTTLTMPAHDVTVRGVIDTLTLPTYRVDTVTTELDRVVIRTITPEQPIGRIALLHDVNGSAENWMKDVEKHQFVRDALQQRFALLFLESVESAFGDQNQNGSEEWRLFPFNLQNPDIAATTVTLDQLPNRTLPLFTLGVGNGGTFASGLASAEEYRATALFSAPPSENSGSNAPPPHIFCLAENDPEAGTVNKESFNYYQWLLGQGVKSQYAIHSPSPLYPQRFARIKGIDTATSRQIFAEITRESALNTRGYLTESPATFIEAILNKPGQYPVIASLSPQQQAGVLEECIAVYADHGFYSDLNKTTLRFFTALINSAVASRTEVASQWQIYPQPSRGLLTVILTVEKQEQIHMAAYDLLGREIDLLVNSTLDPGVHRIEWKTDIPAGSYLLQLTTSETTSSRLIEIVP